MPPATQAPAVGGPSTSSTSSLKDQRKSAWDPYGVLPPSTRRKLEAKDAAPAKSYLVELSISDNAADERVAGKFLQLDLPEGKISDQRKEELAKREREKEKKRNKRMREGDCGLGGRRKRASRGKGAVRKVSYDAVLAVYHLWLSYMAELLALPIAVPSRTPPTSSSSSAEAPQPLYVSYSLLPTYPTQGDAASVLAREAQINVVAIQTKLVKAEFVGCLLSIKRAKNPSLVGLSGIVLQETQGTFKIVTPKSSIKVLPKQGSVFSITLPLDPPSSASPASASSRELTFDLFGDSFAYRAADRVGKKWKAGTSAGGVELV
ncbi:hypothetical protein JCM8547_001702 [Rhodosporidiobolus lusitaniae]